MLFKQHLARQSRPEVGVLGPDNRHRVLTNTGDEAVVRARPRALWMSAEPPLSRYAVNNLLVCRVLIPSTVAADRSVLSFATTSESTSIRCSSRPLIVIRSNLRLPNHTSEG